MSEDLKARLAKAAAENTSDKTAADQTTLLPTAPAATQTENMPSPQSLDNSKSYQLPSAPSTLHLPESAGGPVVVYDGVFTTSDPEQIKELDKMVKHGTISYAGSRPVGREAVPPTPVRKSMDQNNGIIA